MVFSKLFYCLNMWANTSKHNMSKFLSIQNSATRVIMSHHSLKSLKGTSSNSVVLEKHCHGLKCTQELRNSERHTGLNALRKCPKSLLTQRTRKSRKFFSRNVGKLVIGLGIISVSSLIHSAEGYNNTLLSLKFLSVFLGVILNEKLIFVQFPFFFYYKTFALAWTINLAYRPMHNGASWKVLWKVFLSML